MSARTAHLLAHAVRAAGRTLYLLLGCGVLAALWASVLPVAPL